MHINQNDEAHNPWERRVAPRFRREFTVGLEFTSNQFCESRSINVSATGLRLVVDQALGTDRPVQLTLCLDEDNVVEVDGRTVWQERLGSLGTHVIGVAFNGDDTGPQHRIRDWLESKGFAA